MTPMGTLSIALTSWIVFGVSFAVLEPSAAQADCAQWDFRGIITFVQSNGPRVDFKLTQTGSELQGGAGYQWISGEVRGSIHGGNFELTVYWNNAKTGVYKGFVTSEGRIYGSTYEQQNPGSTASWHGERALECMPVARSLPNPYEDPIRHGHTPGQPADTPPATPPDTPPDPLEQSGVVHQPPGGAGNITVDPLEESGVVKQPPGGTGNIFKGMKP